MNTYSLVPKLKNMQDFYERMEQLCHNQSEENLTKILKYTNNLVNKKYNNINKNIKSNNKNINEKVEYLMNRDKELQKIIDYLNSNLHKQNNSLQTYHPKKNNFGSNYFA